MYTQTPSGKASKGSVVVMAEKGRLRLQMPRALYGGNRKYLYLGLADTPENRKAAEVKARQIELDILSDNFDSTLAKYKPQTHLTVVEKPNPAVTLKDGWEMYFTFRRATWSPSTTNAMGNRFRQVFNKIPESLEWNSGVQVRDWLMRNYTPDSCRRTLQQFSACGDWLVSSGKIPSHSFTGLANEIRISRSKKRSNEIDPFTREERDRIIDAFKTNQYCSRYAAKDKRHSNYAGFVKFLFFTGCRPSEAKGLKWEDIHEKFILFRQSVVPGENGYEEKEGLKTQAERKFLINGQLRAILEDAKQKSKSEYVFPSPTGGFIDQGNFSQRVWKPLLVAMGIRYREPYQTRHTFITLCLESGIDVKDVSRWVGNSPEIIYKHYAGNKRNLLPPEL
ncbi:MAG: site-specific integrase [Desertifilum sp.]|nr:site-specific integrase [Desertifilum sp.]